MLSLDKLSIKGFKSFVEPTEFEVKYGLTGIVGPNGFGKSNIVEAIRFGLGEVSAKQLRGKEIDDLIFNGTDNRPSWNLAEVSLFVNLEGSDLENKFQTKQLDISRKIYRGEGSSSFINGKEVKRLLDQGKFAPTPLTIKIVKQRLDKPDAQKGYIFDGFPRSDEQAKMMEEQGIEYDYVINLLLPEEEIIKRLTARGREDD